jgi:hypothetical protein
VFSGENLFHFQVSAADRAIPLTERRGFIEIAGSWSAAPVGDGQAPHPGRAAAAPGDAAAPLAPGPSRHSAQTVPRASR